ncbi:helix-turn-helix domain-containing protein [Streptosporangium sp. NPDC001559]|uniref:helix-turn-helix domain-containing protein n=1 Tax=Streptosporangium sp. NPDC001559 TaxID=3366187 RepID=UPI0036E9A94C
MSRQPYTVEQVADLLGLHVKTVRGYVRDGRLRATRIGKRYRIAREDLEAFTGQPVEPPAAETAGAAGAAGTTRSRRVEVSCVVQVDAIGVEETMRLSNTLIALATGGTHDDGRLRVETIYDEERASLKIIILGGAESGAEILRVITTLAGERA